MPDSSPYSALAAGYDVVMEHVDYVFWAHYIHKRIQQFHPAAQTMLELGCGTGSLALELAPHGPYHYLGTDGVPEMVRVAEAKAEFYNADLSFAVADFTNFRVEPPVDVLLLLYDGLNYLINPDDIRRLLGCAHAAVAPGGLFVFDQSTPANSVNNEAYFEDAGEAEGFAYVRHSRYDAEQRLHTTTFDLTVEGQTFHETHVQRAYSRPEIQALLDETPFEVLATYGGFSTLDATDASERIHWLLRRP